MTFVRGVILTSSCQQHIEVLSLGMGSPANTSEFIALFASYAAILHGQTRSLCYSTSAKRSCAELMQRSFFHVCSAQTPVKLTSAMQFLQHVLVRIVPKRLLYITPYRIVSYRIITSASRYLHPPHHHQPIPSPLHPHRTPQ